MKMHLGRTPLPALLATISIFLLPAIALADTATVERTIDLAQPLNDDWSIPDGATVTVKLIHKVPRASYNTQYPKYTLNPSALDTANVFKPSPPPTPPTPPSVPLVTVAPTGCPRLDALLKQLVNGTEKDVQANLDAITAIPACAADQAFITLAAETEETIPISDIYPSIGADEGVLLKITRVSGTNPPPPWTLNIHPGTGNGKFLTNYTFGFALNRDKAYFANGTGNDAKIAEQVKRDKAQMIPLVLFSFLSRDKAIQSGVFSWTAGLGYDLSNPVVALGGIWTWNRNIGISFGLLSQKQQRLKGKYHIGDPIAANTESKDLTDPTWGPNVFLGVSIRSVSALFK
jgi:hypothetical protein